MSKACLKCELQDLTKQYLNSTDFLTKIPRDIEKSLVDKGYGDSVQRVFEIRCRAQALLARTVVENE